MADSFSQEDGGAATDAVSRAIDLGDRQTAHNLTTLIHRIRAVEKKAAVRLVARKNTLAVYVATLAPESLLDPTPTILGMRAIHIARPLHLDTVVESSALLDRLARIERSGFVLYLPPVTVTARWAGTLAPRENWIERAPVAAADLYRVAAEGMAAVDRALPQNPGHAVVNTVRSRIWSSPMTGVQPDGIVLPSGVAFSAVVLGFLPANYSGSLRCFSTGDWVRLNAPAGFILVKNGRNPALSL